MYIEDLLNYKLKLELFDEIIKLYDKNTLTYNKKIFKKIILKKIDSKLKNVHFLTPKNKFEYKEYHCKARMWDNHFGSRCRYCSIPDNDYCKHHINMINKSGKLKFGRYDENKPITNEKGNLIPWFNKDKILIVDDIIQKDMMAIDNFLRHKNRKITPRF